MTGWKSVGWELINTACKCLTSAFGESCYMYVDRLMESGASWLVFSTTRCRFGMICCAVLFVHGADWEIGGWWDLVGGRGFGRTETRRFGVCELFVCATGCWRWILGGRGVGACVGAGIGWNGRTFMRHCCRSYSTK